MPTSATSAVLPLFQGHILAEVSWLRCSVREGRADLHGLTSYGGIQALLYVYVDEFFNSAPYQGLAETNWIQTEKENYIYSSAGR